VRAAGGRRTAAALALLAAAAVCPAGALRAQSLPFEAIPFGGVVLPVGKLVQQGTAQLSHPAAVTFGGRLDAWLTRSTAVELVISYSVSGYHAVSSSGQVTDTTGALFAATGRFVYRFATSGPVSWQVSAGAGVMAHSGSFLENLASSGRQHLVGVVGLTGRLQVSEGTALVLTAEDYVCSVKLSGIPGIAAAAHLNNYPMFSLGIVVPLGARGEEDDYRTIR